MANWELASATLSDQHAPWCAWCLDYISQPADLEDQPVLRQLEDHHVLATKMEIKKVLGLEPWFIPVHNAAYGKCHRKGLQVYADFAARKLLEAAEMVGTRFEDQCKGAFDAGYLAKPLSLRRLAMFDAIRRGQRVEAHQHLLFALNAAAGCGWGRPFVKEIENDPGLLDLINSRDVKVYIASVRANGGEISPARGIYQGIEVPRVHGAGTTEYAKYVRMLSIVSPDLTLARESLSIAADSPDRAYHTRTSLLARASAHEHMRDYPAAREDANEIWSSLKQEDTSWWHYIEQQLLFGRALILSDGPHPTAESIREGFHALIRAQYASAFFDFRGIPTVDFRLGGEKDVTSLTATDAIHYFGQQFQLTKGQMTELRCQSILGTSYVKNWKERLPGQFQAKVLNTLCANPRPSIL
ncbi:MAG: hypothetical protein WAO35_26965 [Terriglobia bacterium]